MVKKDNSYEENESVTWEKLQSEQLRIIGSLNAI